ncbi:MAG: hypothetical protein HQK86_13300 [Nitrospinae bacterium]|nr:hypothetical protein [Nitrospinota bacterium]MBF0633789.1 hypothetical protein [Nitrospinota bacterium]
MKSKFALAALLATAPIVVSCAGTARSKFQIHENPLMSAVRDKTRTVKLYSQFDTIVIFDATLYDMDVRRAKVDEESSIKRLGAEEKDSMLKVETADDVKEAQFVLGVYAAKDEWNDLADKSSRWTLLLDTPTGPVRPSSVTKVERDNLALRDNLPYQSTFRKFYIVKFPRDKVNGAPYRMVMSGLLGEVSVLWEK